MDCRCLLYVSNLLAAVSFAFILEAAMVARGGQPSGQHLSESNNILSFSFRANNLHAKMITGRIETIKRG